MLKAKDVMTTNVITVTPSTTIEKLAEILIENRISGVPVVDDSQNLVGIVTENDMISQDKRLHIPTIMRLFDAYVVLEKPGKLEEEIKKMAAATVGDICTKKILTVTEDTSVQEIATMISEKKIHLIPVVEGKKIKGIIGKTDLIKGMMRQR